MITTNSISGGQTSSYIAKNYPANFNIFALVTTDDIKCQYSDSKIRQIVSDKIGKEFIGTLEDDLIITTILDLEQFIGTKIDWVVGKSFDKQILRHKKNGQIKTLLPAVMRRTCTFDMKIQPIFDFWLKNINEITETRIGFRANETRRANNMTNRTNKNGVLSFKTIVGKHKNGNNKWAEIPFQIPKFPLIEDNIYKDTIVEYWKDKPVKFAYMNNCVGCFHRNPVLLKHMSQRHENKFQWFIDREKEAIKSYNENVTWKQGMTYEQIKNTFKQTELFDTDFNECDSGYCGL